MEPSAASLLGEINRQLFASLDAREARVAAQEADANHILLECDAERRKIKAERETLLAAQRLQSNYLVGIGLDPLPVIDPLKSQADSVTESLTESARLETENERHRRARVGPQRYRILKALQLLGPLALEALTDISGLSEKRVKDQLRVDVPIIIHRVPCVADGRMTVKLALSPSGDDLLTRFESYKRGRGEPLPPLQGDIDEAEAEEELEVETE